MVLYLTWHSFPDGGMAGVNRVKHLSHAFVTSGIRVRVLTPFSDSGRRERVEIDGVLFESLCVRSNNRFMRYLSNWVVYPWRILQTIVAERKSEKVLLYSYVASVLMMTVHKLISLLTHCPIAAEECEYPFSILTHAAKFTQWYESRVVPLFYDGMVCISENLIAYYAPRIRRNCKSIYIPMTVDCDRFTTVKGGPVFDFDYIAYAGAMRREGGGVDVLVKAFALVADRHPRLHLVLIGKGDERLKEGLLSICGMKDRMHFLFTGSIPAREMPRYIANAKILATLPLPTFQQQGCFPTKLGEYLASGVPAVVSKVGNPVAYLTDRENVYFVPPNDPVATAKTFDEILSDYSSALLVGKAGRDFARRSFHYANFAEQLADWYREIVGDVG